MKAMVLAAGLGTRLKPLTDKMPKALVEVEGVPMMERVILNLKKQGFDYIVVNVYHFAPLVIEYLSSKDYGIKIVVSNEEDALLDTGGGIVKAEPLLFAENDEPVLIHNVDILSNAHLTNLIENTSGTTSLLVSKRDSSRKLIFDSDMKLKGWHDLSSGRFRPDNLILEPSDTEFAFSGIYTITKEAVEEMRKLMGDRKFSIIDYFLNPLRQEEIKGIEVKDLKLLDIGKPATLLQASGFILNNIINS